MPRPFTRRQRAQNRRFLIALAKTGNARLAAARLGVHRSTYLRRRAKCPAFAACWDEALAAADARLERSVPAPGSASGRARYRPRQKPRPALRTSGGEPVLVRSGGRRQLRIARAGAMAPAAAALFFATLGKTANIRFAAAAAGFAHTSLLARARRDPAFAAAVERILAAARPPIERRLAEAEAARAAQAARLAAIRALGPHDLYLPGLDVAEALRRLRVLKRGVPRSER